MIKKIRLALWLAIDRRRNKSCIDCTHGLVCMYAMQDEWDFDCKLYRWDWKKWLKLLLKGQ